MAALSMLRLARRLRLGAAAAAFPNLDTLLDEEAGKMKDGYAYARWIVPLSCFAVGLLVFLPLALWAHNIFWLFLGIFLLTGTILGTVFHHLARKITPTQMEMRQRCYRLALRCISVESLLGSRTILSPEVGAVLDEGAGVYLASRPVGTRDLPRSDGSLWQEAKSKGELALDQAMIKLLTLAEPESPAGQEALLAQGWAQPLVAEMRETAQAILATQAQEVPVPGLQTAREELESLSQAEQELHAS